MSLIKITEVEMTKIYIYYNINQRGKYTIHAVTPTKCQNYPSTTMREHSSVLAKGSKSPYML